MEHIYALYYEQDDQRRYFYIGRTGRDPKIRKNEHKLKSRTGTEDVYEFIREKLEPNGIAIWDLEVLTLNTNASYEDCEDFWVVLMIRAGYDLKNMKHGDQRKIADLVELAKTEGDFTTVEEFQQFRKRVEREQYEASERLKKYIKGMEPSPRNDLQDILAVSLEKYKEQNGQQRQRRIKREARELARAREKAEWLGRQSGLFDIE